MRSHNPVIANEYSLNVIIAGISFMLALSLFLCDVNHLVNTRGVVLHCAILSRARPIQTQFDLAIPPITLHLLMYLLSVSITNAPFEYICPVRAGLVQ